MTQTLDADASISAPAAEDKLPLALKVSWATGALGVALLMNTVSGLALFYLTKIIGISGLVAGILLMISKLYDAFLGTDASRYRKATEIIVISGRNEIGETVIELLRWLRHLLSQEIKLSDLRTARIVCEKFNVIAQ